MDSFSSSGQASTSSGDIVLVQYPGLTARGTLSGPCGKVHMALHYKGLTYRVKNASSPTQVKRYNPRGRVPALILGEGILVDSTDILSELEDRFPDPPLQPPDAPSRARVKILEDWADEVLYFYSVHQRWVDPLNFARLRAVGMDRLPIPARWIMPAVASRIVRNRLRGQGVGLKDHVTVRRELRECFEAIVTLLGSGSWLVGERFTRADLALAALLDQLNLEQVTPDIAYELRAMPAIMAWLERVHEQVPNAALL